MQSKPGSFSAYLEYAQRNDSASQSRPSSASLLNVLNQFPDRAAPMSSICDRSGMSASDFREALKKLSDSGFVKISGEPLSELVALTDKGREAASLF